MDEAITKTGWVPFWTTLYI